MDNPKSAAILAAALAAAFETRHRDNGNAEFVTLRHGSPEWMREAIRAAHGDELPDDSVYQACRRAAEYLADNDPESWGDLSHEWADSYVDAYNSARVAWLAEKPLIRGPLCEEAAEELGTPTNDVFELIGWGQYQWSRNIIGALADAIESEADTNPCAWRAGWNLPGCLPESDPEGFETWDEARDYIADELERFAESEADTDDGRPIRDEDEARAAADALGDADEDAPVTVHAAGYAYWIEAGSAEAD